MRRVKQKLYIFLKAFLNMEMINIPKAEYERMKQQIARLRELEETGYEESSKDVKPERMRNFLNQAQKEKMKELWDNKEDEVWEDA